MTEKLDCKITQQNKFYSSSPRFSFPSNSFMEVKEEPVASDERACCICNSTDSVSLRESDGSFIKYKDSFEPFASVIQKTLHFEVNIATS